MTVIQAAEKLGISIPRYCYHPGLSLAGSCRMCLVEIENVPNLQISCYTRVQDGMKVSTTSERVLRARQAMLEFLLTNHPLDCPVCDQSGECDLQNFYMDYGRHNSTFLENKVKRRKAFPIGPHVILDQERCVLCTRCVRFTEEVSNSNELGVLNRGNRSVIDLYPGKTLDNPYSGNVIDICPVGALTEREFRFQCRVWYLSTQDSICTGCSRGCNTSIHYNQDRPHKAGGKRVMRLKPRFNPEVNKWWLCDEGRFGFEFIDKDRIEGPHVSTAAGLMSEDWDAAVQKAATAIRQSIEEHGTGSVGVVVSPKLSNEELLTCRKLFVDALGLSEIALRNPWEQAGTEDDFLKKADRNPNTRGAEELGFTGDAKSILEKAASGAIKVLYILWHDFSSDEAVELLKKAECVIYQGINWNKTAELADVILAGTSHAEKDGTFTNFEGRIQRFQQALLPLEDTRSDMGILAAVGGELGHSVTASPEEAFTAWQSRTYDELTEHGVLMGSDSAVQA